VQEDLLDRLYRIMSEEPLRRKVLLVRSYAQGHQLLEQLCKRHGAVYHADVQTIRGLIEDRTRLELYRRKIRLLDEGQTLWAVRSLMSRLAAGQPSCYINEDMLKPGIVDSVRRAVTDMRLAGVRSADMQPHRFANPDKGEYLKRLLAAYERYLQERRLTDFAGLIEFLAPESARETEYVAFEPTGWSGVERSMVEKLAGTRLTVLEPDEPFYANDRFAANSFTLFRATGTWAEVREGFRRMLGDAAPLDQTEIIVSDYDRYAPIVQAQAEILGIPCTLAAGLPMNYCRAGRAAFGIVAWIEEGYPAARLAAMLRHKEMTFPDDRWTSGDWVRFIENSGIGWGRNRYLQLLRPERLSEETKEQGAYLLRVFEKWFAGLPDGNDWDPIRLLQWIASFASAYAAGSSAEDVQVQTALKDLADRHAETPSEPMPKDLAIRYVKDLLKGQRIRVSAAPKPGAVHVSSLQDGGWSGRSRTWLVGMDESAWSMRTAQDPVLLDEERAAISAALPSADRLARIRKQERDARLALIRGEVWLSYSSYDPGEQKGNAPAFEMLQIFRLKSGERDADFGAMDRASGESCGVMDAPRAGANRVPIDAGDVWAALFPDGDGKRKDGWNAVLRAYPHFAEGHRAHTLRRSESLTAYDGWVRRTEAEEAGEERGVPVISASQLELYAGCGLKYFFSSVLKLRAKETAEFDRSRWLRPHERGDLLHRIYRRYLEQATEHGTRQAAHDRAVLNEVTEAAIGEAAAAIPAPSPHVYEKECEDIRRDVDIFYRQAKENADQPCYFELELSQDGEPMEVALPGGVRFRMKGFVDRVDRIGPHRYRIIDYKTGGTSKYKPSEYFGGGTQLQHALYSVAVEQWLRRTGRDPEAVVAEADYAFPTVRGRGEYVRRPQRRREELARVVSRLLESRESGLYLPTRDGKLCVWCEYRGVCGNHSEWAAAKRASAEHADALQALLEVEESE